MFGDASDCDLFTRFMSYVATLLTPEISVIYMLSDESQSLFDV
jgi:hypothetical protein